MSRETIMTRGTSKAKERISHFLINRQTRRNESPYFFGQKIDKQIRPTIQLYLLFIHFRDIFFSSQDQLTLNRHHCNYCACLCGHHRRHLVTVCQAWAGKVIGERAERSPQRQQQSASAPVRIRFQELFCDTSSVTVHPCLAIYGTHLLLINLFFGFILECKINSYAVTTTRA